MLTGGANDASEPTTSRFPESPYWPSMPVRSEEALLRCTRGVTRVDGNLSGI